MAHCESWNVFNPEIELNLTLVVCFLGSLGSSIIILFQTGLNFVDRSYFLCFYFVLQIIFPQAHTVNCYLLHYGRFFLTEIAIDGLNFTDNTHLSKILKYSKHNLGTTREQTKHWQAIMAITAINSYHSLLHSCCKRAAFQSGFLYYVQ